MDEPITKRLHVSGLTPAITPDDLAKRFGSFGEVKAMDGFGLVDAVGQPRKFGYISLETTKKDLSRCLNVLSGVTWKGTKLRVGEARPDFRERIAQEHEAMRRSASGEDDDRPNKRRRLPRGVQGVHAADMSLVTPENAATRPGWHVTALGRVIRPIRMRPDHPLPDPQEASAVSGKGKTDGKKRKRVREPPAKARRRKIDPTAWGSVHLKGAFLQNAILADVPRSTPFAVTQPSLAEEGAHSGSGSDESGSEDTSDVEELLVDEKDLSDRSSSQHSADQAHKPPQPEPPRPEKPNDAQTDFREETQKSLGLLQALFGDKGDEDWGDKESVGSDVEADNSTNQDPTPTTAVEDRQNEIADNGASVQDATEASQADKHASALTQTTKLKDLFAPREEDAGFSLLGHLDLDLELDEDVDLQLPGHTSAQAERDAPLPTAIPTTLSSFDTKAPLFFPPPPVERNRGRMHDVLDPTNWRTWFYRTDTEDVIQKRWEEAKGELTAEWKRRHREAVKSRRRRGGGTGDAEL